MKVGIFPVPLGLEVVFGLDLWVDLLISLGDWGGGAKTSFLTHLCACRKA